MLIRSLGAAISRPDLDKKTWGVVISTRHTRATIVEECDEVRAKYI